MYTCPGPELNGGGLIGAALGVPLVNACGKVGALVILGLGIFICVMFLTGSTLAGLYSGMVEKPARKVSEAYSDAVDTLSQRMSEAEPRRAQVQHRCTHAHPAGGGSAGGGRGRGGTGRNRRSPARAMPWRRRHGGSSRRTRRRTSRRAGRSRPRRRPSGTPVCRSGGDCP
ncbi:MAG: hypothetical protein V8Q30_01460 [Acutalibacteraceae bacterium]